MAQPKLQARAPAPAVHLWPRLSVPPSVWHLPAGARGLVWPTPVRCTCDYKKLSSDYLQQLDVSGIYPRSAPTWRFRSLPHRSGFFPPHEPGPMRGALPDSPGRPDRPRRRLTGPSLVRCDPRNGAPNAASDRRGRPPSLLLLADCLAVQVRNASLAWPGTIAGPAAAAHRARAGTTPSVAAGCRPAARAPRSPGTAGDRPGCE